MDSEIKDLFVLAFSGALDYVAGKGFLIPDNYDNSYVSYRYMKKLYIEFFNNSLNDFTIKGFFNDELMDEHHWRNGKRVGTWISHGKYKTIYDDNSEIISSDFHPYYYLY